MMVQDLVELHIKCGHKRIDPFSVDIKNAVLSSKSDGKKPLGMKFRIHKITSTEPVGLDGLEETKDEAFEKTAKIFSPESSTYVFGSAKAAVVEYKGGVYVSFVQNKTRGNKNGAMLFQKLFQKHKPAFYIVVDDDKKIKKLERNGKYKTIITDQGEFYAPIN